MIKYMVSLSICRIASWVGASPWWGSPHLTHHYLLLEKANILSLHIIVSVSVFSSNRNIHFGVMWTPTSGVRALWLQWKNSHGLQKSSVEKGTAWPISEWERAPTLAGQAFIAFLGTLHGGWSWFTMHRFSTGDYLLRTTKDRILLITSKRRML